MSALRFFFFFFFFLYVKNATVLGCLIDLIVYQNLRVEGGGGGRGWCGWGVWGGRGNNKSLKGTNMYLLSNSTLGASLFLTRHFRLVRHDF